MFDQTNFMVVCDVPVEGRILVEQLKEFGAISERITFALNTENDTTLAIQQDDIDIILLYIDLTKYDNKEWTCDMLQCSERPAILFFSRNLVNSSIINDLLDHEKIDVIGSIWHASKLKVRIKNLLANHFSQKYLEQKVRERTQEVLARLSLAAEFRDNETSKHVERVSKYTHIIAKRYGLGEKICQLYSDAAPMHDVGKIGVPDRILLKPEKLTDDEFEIIKAHPICGSEILADSESPLIKTVNSRP